MAVCGVCFRHCDIPAGGVGFCGARTCRDGEVTALNYGLLTSLALDPIEKKPLYRFHPGSRILSAGSFGCNLRCPFCQNYQISWSEEAFRFAERAEYVSPEQLAATADYYRKRGNIGVAFTYNEPLIGYEYVRDTGKLLRGRGLKTVLVTNGMAERAVLEELAPYVDAMNIDLKGFTERYYRDVLKGDLEQVKSFIARAVQVCHVELTTLIVPGENDREEEMRELAAWVAGLTDPEGRKIGTDIPLHVTRFFPRFHMTDRPATEVRTVRHLAAVAREKLNYVYIGNC
ncbi:MAG: AmmeMemoRadiSam system radical SAM enzyme [Firmicutes bacterium]|nr:AmmeMemoRadiSam system radical SAM enzyme [Bacillota bacterium]